MAQGMGRTSNPDNSHKGREPDPDDYESRQASHLTYDGPDDADDPDRDLLDAEIRQALRHAVFHLQYATRCDRCRRVLPPGTNVIGRKIDERWVIEELDPCPPSAGAVAAPGG